MVYSQSPRGGRDRSRRDYPVRSADKNHHGRNNPPSRHLWVGNLSHSISERTLADLFYQFGALESVAFQVGRSYAFINFKNEEDAFAAMRELQGFLLAGNALKIEFTKAEKASTSSPDEEYFQRRDPPHSNARESPYSQRDIRPRHSSPDSSYPDKTKMTDRNTAPSEVLWIGFPALLKVDETALRKAFSPFGEVEKVTVFPGRSYAFIRFKSITAACRAKETLQGKLFDNPRVHICFAKNDYGTSNSGRNSLNAPLSPSLRTYGRSRSPDTFRSDRKYRNLTDLNPEMDTRDPDIASFSRKRNFWPGGNGEFEQRRLQEGEPEYGLPGNMYDHRPSSPRGNASRFHDFSPQQFPQQGPFHDDSWDLPEDNLSFHGAKRQKMISFPHENELPEYPFTDSEQMKHKIPPPFPEFSKPEVLDPNYDSGYIGYKRISVGTTNANQRGERRDHMHAPYDGFQTGAIPLSPTPIEWKRQTPEPKPSLAADWKWEGVIAKGGTPVCRARCFPVGKSMDMMLPEFLDCTARTSLDMLAKHYYQAAGAWVVFFVPHGDADMGFYNEFMNYLGEKQRAAVAKLDEKTTLFLVPPSEFSEKVLKVPGKLSISGVVLRLEPLGSDFVPQHHSNERRDMSFVSFDGDASYANRPSPPGSYSNEPSFSKPGLNISTFPGDFSAAAQPAPFSNSSHSYGNMMNSINENKHEYVPNERSHVLGTNLLPHQPQNLNAASRPLAPQITTGTIDTMVRGYNAVIPKVMQETSSNNYTSGPSGNASFRGGKLPLPDTQPTGSSSLPASDFQAEQLAQLASSLVGQHQQLGGINAQEHFRQPNAILQPENSYRPPNMFCLPNQVAPGISSSQFSQVHSVQQHQTSGAPVAPQRELQATAPANEQPQGSGMQTEADADPQKRLQATLQLAAALLQQIQQGKGS